MLPKNVSSSILPYHSPPSYEHVVRIYFKFLASVAHNLKMPIDPAIEYRSTNTDAQENMESMEKNSSSKSCICVTLHLLLENTYERNEKNISVGLARKSNSLEANVDETKDIAR